MHTDVLILGAGASGLYCAAHAAALGRKVTLLDHGNRAARKVLISGGGRCNFTNLNTKPGDYLCKNPHFVKSALARHTPYNVLNFFASRGIEAEDKQAGQLFSRQGAKALARVLVDECASMGARLELGCTINDVIRTQNGFLVHTSQGEFTAPSLVLALGGPSWPQAGSTDLGFRLARQFRLKMVQPCPALVPLTLSSPELEICRTLSGIALPVRLASNRHTESNDLLFTHKGLSGPAILQISSHWTKGNPVSINLLPSHDLADIFKEHRGAKMQLKSLLGRFLPSRLPVAILGKTLASTPINLMTSSQLKTVAKQIHEWTVTPSGTEGYKKAEVTAGGIHTDAFSSKTFEAKNIPGLFAIGEVLDVTGRLGGFNLQWAWSSAFAAAQFV